jgi:hypothetical protein
MIRRLRDRLRSSRATLWYRRLDGSDDECGKPWTTELLLGAPEPPVDDLGPAPALDDAAGGIARHDADPGPVDHDLLREVQRVADAFERIAASIEADRREHGARLEAVETILRNLVSGVTSPTSVPPVVVGGSIDLSEPSIDALESG